MLLATFPTLAQSTGVLTGTVRDRKTQESLPGVTVILEGTNLGAASDAEGRYRLTDIPVGSYNVRASIIGYDMLLRANVVITSGNASIINLELSSNTQQLAEVEVVGSRAIRVATAETPLSVQRINTEEIKSNPGAILTFQK
ncbi:carboxypeptidase-like regulatory domain-containing protein [Hymenobacter radiodurans]|uniref:carboxypeptidase-like regulatory domain-containing protein n=1 Tax=Hymenobacter radiodurans TaxID=2496028 RepID=UPI001F112094|nr:carboxypeptidase-like regulatory domain-containing protein [Hymenobacter radiodurans]